MPNPATHPETMRAVRTHAPGTPIVVEEVPWPEAGPGEVVVRIAACGVCHSDVHVLDGLPMPAPLPLTLGHEPAGVIEALGEGVTDWSVGDRVAMHLGDGCGRERDPRRHPLHVRRPVGHHVGLRHVPHRVVAGGLDVEAVLEDHRTAERRAHGPDERGNDGQPEDGRGGVQVVGPHQPAERHVDEQGDQRHHHQQRVGVDRPPGLGAGLRRLDAVPPAGEG
ncbi:MAG: hypothetical protein DYH08_09835, partial [Actinobacteria bacterium ATB1]|nr:hypothetical protein [Actinobacteria bacterium ATB1]